MDVETPARSHQRVPHLNRIRPCYPDLVSQIAGIASAGYIHRHTADGAAGLAEVLQVPDFGFGNALQQAARRGPLQRQSRHLLGDVFDLDIESDSILPEPAQVGISSRPAVTVLLQPCDGAVIDDLAFLVAPAAVDHLIDRNLVNVAGNDAIDE